MKKKTGFFKYLVGAALLLTAGIGGTVGVVKAMSTIFTTTTTDAVTYSRNFDFELDPTPPTRFQPIDYMTVQIVYSSSTPPAKTFTDGRVSTGSFTVNTVSGLSSAPATDQITVGATSLLTAVAASNHLTVVSASTNAYVGQSITINGVALRAFVDWTPVTTTTGTAAALATAISQNFGLNVSRVNSVVYTTATVAGEIGNTYTMASSTVAITVASANFTGGQNPALANAILTINGHDYRAGYEWKVADTSTGTAKNIATMIGLIPGTTAQASGSVVYATATVAGAAGNLNTVVSSTPSALAVLTPTFTGGQDNAVVSINGVNLTQGVDWIKGASAALTAKAISDAIMASSSLNTIVQSTWTSGGVVKATSTTVGLATNYGLTSSTAAITASGANMTGGLDPAYSSGTATIGIASHGFSTGLPVLYSTGGVAITGLTNQTTYYVVKVDADHIKLSSTSVVAQSGVGLVLSSLSTAGPHTFTLTPLTYSGTAGFYWQVSNDGTTFSNYTTTSDGVAISSVTYSSPSANASTTTWNLGAVNYKKLRLVVDGPSNGALNITILPHGKNSN